MEQIHGDLPQHSSNNSKYQQRNINSMLEKKSEVLCIDAAVRPAQCYFAFFSHLMTQSVLIKWRFECQMRMESNFNTLIKKTNKTRYHQFYNQHSCCCCCCCHFVLQTRSSANI